MRLVRRANASFRQVMRRDRRRYVRIPVRMDGVFQSRLGEQVRMVTLDLSSGGLLVHTSAAIAPGTTGMLRLPPQSRFLVSENSLALVSHP